MAGGEVSRIAGRRSLSGPTIADVAQLAGVSTMTVSRVANQNPRVSEETRQRVLSAIAQLGYVPNQAARKLAGRRECRIGLLHSNPSSAYLNEFLVGSLEAAAQVDAEIVVEAWPAQASLEEVVARLQSHRIDAVLAPPPLCDNADLLDALQHIGVAIAQIATGQPMAGATVVSLDDRDAARAMTAHLVGQGHRRIAFIRGAADQTASVLRQAGYEDALAEAGIALDPALIADGEFTYRSGLAAAEKLLALDPPPTAIFASNDDMAAGVLSTAHRHGIDVPQGLSVVGFDDSAIADTVWPGLTTIRQPVAEMARRATIELAERVRNEQDREARRTILPYTLVKRESDSTPAG
ncbi:LacI family DNA-binding transcriptional regulator [Novosphingobium sp. TH158]|uniref:LacI family DNA-binding transcriptional regulator n=1 Tax=Novosphingobium sp. TH158 TaxID=2067455 RepID=UPI000C7A1818|nr:LacI family DNA-binding transcriptional regulator [Novosphingobium sp. TH158]PLK23998.1 LacI family transcriptional regulator [Novosphingobium sp. TH158]